MAKRTIISVHVLETSILGCCSHVIFLYDNHEEANGRHALVPKGIAIARQPWIGILVAKEGRVQIIPSLYHGW
jgi:hypothetical protein